MAKEVFISTKDLPQLPELKNGDYIFAQTSTGLKMVDYKNVILPKENTLITATVEENTNAITSLSGETLTKITALSSELKSVSDSNVYIGAVQIEIESGNSSATRSIYPSTDKTLSLNEIIVVPANAYAAKFPAYVTKVNGNEITIKGTFYKNVIINTGTYNIGTISTLDTEKLSSFTSQSYVSTLSTNPTDVYNFVSQLALSSISINAEETAAYNILIVKT